MKIIEILKGLNSGNRITAWSGHRIIKIDGSSTIHPITELVAEEFRKAKRGATEITLGISGTGGGFKKFCRGETDISNASRPVFIYVNRRSAERPEVKEFVEFYLRNAPKLARQVKCIPLPDRAYKLAAERFAKGVIGTVFGGEVKVAMKMEEFLKLPW